MVCYKPIKGYFTHERTKTGKFAFTTNASLADTDRKLDIPCGQCIGCRLDRAKMWAVRCVHESQLHEKNCFITLTFNEKYWHPSLDVRTFQLFLKRLRRAYPETKIRFFHCGEYGEELQRPHHHAILFGFDFPDKELWSIRDDVKLYRSKALEALWSNPETKEPYGFCTIGDVTYESAAYVARYCVKKINGKKAQEHYLSADLDTGECTTLKPEYVTMSRRPGIASDWIHKYHNDVYSQDFVVLNEKIKCKTPKYYDKIYDRICHSKDELENIKVKRIIKAKDRKEDSTIERLETRLGIQERKAKKLVRIGVEQCK